VSSKNLRFAKRWLRLDRHVDARARIAAIDFGSVAEEVPSDERSVLLIRAQSMRIPGMPRRSRHHRHDHEHSREHGEHAEAPIEHRVGPDAKGDSRLRCVSPASFRDEVNGLSAVRSKACVKCASI
jgi:hypothetical protein